MSFKDGTVTIREDSKERFSVWYVFWNEPREGRLGEGLSLYHAYKIAQDFIHLAQVPLSTY